MRRRCQVYKRDGSQCEEPAVDFGEVVFKDGSIKIWMCAHHWDEHQKTKRGKWS